MTSQHALGAGAEVEDVQPRSGCERDLSAVRRPGDVRLRRASATEDQSLSAAAVGVDDVEPELAARERAAEVAAHEGELLAVWRPREPGKPAAARTVNEPPEPAAVRPDNAEPAVVPKSAVHVDAEQAVSRKRVASNRRMKRRGDRSRAPAAYDPRSKHRRRDQHCER